MTARCAPLPNPGPLYFAECSYGRLGNEFQALDRDKNSRNEIIREIRSGGITPIKILEVTEPCEDFPLGLVADVTDELIAEAEAEREPRTLDEIAEQLRGMLVDRERDLKKHGVFGW
jgi:hypothetical protein